MIIVRTHDVHTNLCNFINLLVLRWIVSIWYVRFVVYHRHSSIILSDDDALCLLDEKYSRQHEMNVERQAVNGARCQSRLIEWNRVLRLKCLFIIFMIYSCYCREWCASHRGKNKTKTKQKAKRMQRTHGILADVHIIYIKLNWIAFSNSEKKKIKKKVMKSNKCIIIIIVCS